jgi:hypothetical protein
MLGSKTWLRTIAISALALACGGEAPPAPAEAEREAPTGAARTRTTPTAEPVRTAEADAEEATVAATENRPPLMLEVEIDDRENARSDRDLTARPSAEDPDGDTVAFEYRWSLNGRTLDDVEEVLSHTRFERSDRIGLSIRATDGEDSSDWWRAEPFEIGNSAPRITSIPGDFDPDGTFRYPIVVEDTDGDRGLRYEILSGPAGMTIDTVSGTLIWTPKPDQGGVHPVKISVRDRHDGEAIQDFDVRVGFEDFEAPASPQP